MGKALAIFGMIVAVCLLLMFGLDLAIAVPFGKVSMTMDVGFVIAAVVLAFLSWTTFRQQP